MATLQRTRREPAPWARFVIVVLMLYVFLVGIGMLEGGIGALGEGFQERLLAQVSNPLAGLFTGVLATVLVQSSSVVTATIVGLVGAGTLGVDAAVPMVMGANIGTTVTSTLAALGNVRQSEDFRRGFAAATVHDSFNLFAVVILFPLEYFTGVLSSAAGALTELLRGTQVSAPGESPIRTIVKLPVDALTGMIDPSGTGGVLVGIMLILFGIVCIFLALGLVTRNMRQLAAGGIERAMNRLVGRGGGAIGILVGLVVTMVVQSSTITTSMLVPMAAAGVLTLRNIYPITLGANVGTTLTALIASLAVIHPEGLTIALVHTLFNLIGLLLIYPVPGVRLLPVLGAEWLADMATDRRWVVFVYVIGLFIVVPVVGLLLLS